MKKYILTILITAIICITGTVIASNYLASEIVYNDTTVENALNELYTTTNTTITGLNTQVTELQNQLDSITPTSKSFTFISGTSPLTFDLGFKAGYVSCVANNVSDDALVMVIYNKDFNSKTVRLSANDDSCTWTRSTAYKETSFWFTIGDTSLTWNVTHSGWQGKTVYCTASK